MAEPHEDDTMREETRMRMEDLPAETALDPEGGGQRDPADYKGNPDR